MSNRPAPSTGTRFKPAGPTLYVGLTVLLLLALGAATSGIGGFLLMLGMAALITGLYVLATGRRSWAMLPGGRKAGAGVLAASLVLLGVGSPLVPTSAENLDPSAASAQIQATVAASPTPTATKKVTATPSATPTPTETGAPLDSDGVNAVPAGTDYNAPQAQPAYGTKALDLLATLPIKGRAPKTGYDRGLFGQAWLDVDRNGCDTRNDILQRDLTSIVYTNSVPCKIQSGVLADPYTGTTIKFLRGSATSSAVQIDHVVALGDAWQKGAQQLSLEQRTAFANDPLNLQATDGPTNQKKGDGDAATWLPPNTSYRCEYVARQIAVKATYTLWVTQAEHDAMARILANCADIMAPTNVLAPEPEPAAEAKPEPVHIDPYPNCSVAAAAGATNIPVGSPGYNPQLDGDRDGIACESSGGAGSQPAPVPAAPAPPAPAPAAPAPPAGNVYYKNCDAVRAAGAAPIYPGQPGFQPKFDGNNDGVGCE